MHVMRIATKLGRNYVWLTKRKDLCVNVNRDTAESNVQVTVVVYLYR